MLSPRVVLLLLILGLIGLPAFAAAEFRPQTHTFKIAGTQFTLQEVDLGAPYGCEKGSMVGIVLRDRNRIVRWSFNVRDTAASPVVYGCLSTTAAHIVGIATPTAQTAIWVITVLSCGGSCYGYDVSVFPFDPSWKPNPRTGEYDLSPEIYERLGLGGVRFAFPRLSLYKNNGYKEVSLALDKDGIQMETSPSGQFILVQGTSYTSRQCYLSNPRRWPPDPGE